MELKNLEFYGEALGTWEYLYVRDGSEIRIFYKAKGEPNEKHGFDFAVIEAVGSSDQKYPFLPEDDVEVIAWGTAYGDGIRHMFFGGDEKGQCNNENPNGYLYYPNTALLSEVFVKLRELEFKMCSEDELQNFHSKW